MFNSIHSNSAKDPAASTQLYLRIAEIHNDIIALKNGGLRAILEVGSVNVNLKSEDEQNALTQSYQNFLNSLEFPIQIVVRSKKVDISGYLGKLQQAGKKQKNELLKNQISEYSEYIRRLVEFADIMEKQFYVVIPHDPLRAKNVNSFQKFWNFIHPADSVGAIRRRQKEFGGFAKDLNQRVDSVAAGLEGCGLQSRRVVTSELIQLFYEIYNPLTARNEKVEDTVRTDLIDPSNPVAEAT